ncbi:hypothetical protein DFH08DRAFT_808776 [Mycena albidolilacea]|uniref:Uncharacterized protein n=1 Tax=Mycena albidolilacea TaxID=1033008 RepID=A0AAD7A3A6_9AGAR|nr:hypothetical protein DFH08DRAFT_808776 [Mycena albidolilacea]
MDRGKAFQRAVQKIKDAQTKIQSHVKKYQQACTAMITLGCDTKNVNEPHALGDGGKAEGWIWQHGYKGNLSAAKEADYVLDFEVFDKMETVWTALVNDHKNDPGKQAYVLKTAT